MNKEQRIKLKCCQLYYEYNRGVPRLQMQFTSLDDFIIADNCVQIMGRTRARLFRSMLSNFVLFLQNSYQGYGRSPADLFGPSAP